MAKKGREFNEIYDLTAMRVIVERDGDEGTRDCYGALGLIHSLWKPMPGRFKDYIAMPKFNGYRSLHTTVIGPQGRPLEMQVRTREMHATAEYGVAAHMALNKQGRKQGDDEWTTWVKQLMEVDSDESDPREFLKNAPHRPLRGRGARLHAEGPGQDAAGRVDADRLRLRRAHRRRPQDGRREGQRPHRAAALQAEERRLRRDPHLEAGPRARRATGSRSPKSSRARNKIRQWFSRETREDQEQKGRDALEQALKQQNLPYAKLRGSSVLAEVIRDSGFKKAEDFYVALGSGKLSSGAIVNKVIQRLKTDEVAEEAPVITKRPRARDAVSGEEVGVVVQGVDDVLVRLAKCCTPVPGDPIVGYISLGKGITIHREDCPNVKALKRNEERFTPIEWDGNGTKSFRVQIAVHSWDRPRLLEDVARTFAEHGANIVSYGGSVEDQLAKNWYTAEVGDVKALRSLLNTLRGLDSVFDAYRVTPS